LLVANVTFSPKHLAPLAGGHGLEARGLWRTGRIMERQVLVLIDVYRQRAYPLLSENLLIQIVLLPHSDRSLTNETWIERDEISNKNLGGEVQLF
jgi:hypothetical protein